MSSSRILGEEMKELKDLANKSLVIRILDHEAYGLRSSEFFSVSRRRRCPSLCVPLCSSKVMYIQICRSQFEMAVSIQQTASEIRDDTKVGT
jgi:hypothetical protein